MQDVPTEQPLTTLAREFELIGEVRTNRFVRVIFRLEVFSGKWPETG